VRKVAGYAIAAASGLGLAVCAASFVAGLCIVVLTNIAYDFIEGDAS